MDELKTTKVARVNEVDILVFENEGDKKVAIKPICQILGIDEDAQRRKLKEDPILSSVAVLSTATGADGKQYEMVTIPFKYVFGWLFRIDSRNVKDEAKESVLKYQLACYDVLYHHFTLYTEFVEHKQKAIDSQLEICESARYGFKNAKNILEGANTQLNKLRKLTLADYDAETCQFKLFTDEQQKGGVNE
jgi:hypothetical protein